MTASPPENAADRFDALDLTRRYAIEIAHRDGERLTLQLIDHSVTDPSPDDPYSREYELTFNMVLGGSVVAEGRGLGLINHWKAYRKSPLLDETKQLSDTYGEEFTHFELTGHSGTLAVVARDFTLTIVRMSRLTIDHTPPAGGEA